MQTLKAVCLKGRVSSLTKLITIVYTNRDRWRSHGVYPSRTESLCVSPSKAAQHAVCHTVCTHKFLAKLRDILNVFDFLKRRSLFRLVLSSKFSNDAHEQTCPDFEESVFLLFIFAFKFTYGRARQLELVAIAAFSILEKERERETDRLAFSNAFETLEAHWRAFLKLRCQEFRAFKSRCFYSNSIRE